LKRDIGKQVKELKPSTSYNSDYWSANAEISRLCQQRDGMESRLRFLDYQQSSHKLHIEESID
jgi:hypothetical protein